MKLLERLGLMNPGPNQERLAKNLAKPEAKVLHFPPLRSIEAFKARITRPKFYPGYLGASQAALGVINLADITRAIERHVQGDWGDVGKDGWEQNDLALQLGEPLLSLYKDRHGKPFLVTTEPNRSLTWVMLPEEC